MLARGCLAPGCIMPSTTWPLRVELDEKRMLVYPACAAHFADAQAASCGLGCAHEHPAQPMSAEAVLDQIALAFSQGYGLGVPADLGAGPVEVLRPLVA